MNGLVVLCQAGDDSAKATAARDAALREIKERQRKAKDGKKGGKK